MRFANDDKTVLIVNDHISLTDIPPQAHEYQVNGRTPLEWFIDRYRITKDKESGIVNDPNSWFDDPRDLIDSIRRVVHLSVETVRIVSGLLIRSKKLKRRAYEYNGGKKAPADPHSPHVVKPHRLR